MLQAFPISLQHEVQRYLPFEIGATLTDNIEPASFSPWVGLLVLCGYTAAALGIGAVLFVRRDA
jgi:ABC-type transport system involved in multi-copper enzyme maturation permease subunit